MASAWKTVEPVETCNLQDIMHEEFARGLQEKENEKFDVLQQHAIEAALADQLQLDEKPKTEPDRQNQLDDIPDDVLNVIRSDKELSESVDFCDSDRLLAEMLQAEFNQQHDEEVSRIERHNNKDSKISISYTNYRLQHPGNAEADEEYEDDDEQPKDWDRFVANEKMVKSINKKGFTHNEDGIRITKHDSKMCGTRNACRVMSFPPEFQTGDTAGIDVALPNTVFNKLKTFSIKSSKHKAQDRTENKATADMAFDGSTRLILYKFISNGMIKEYNGIISTGKEAVILHADSNPNYEGDTKLPAECAIKVFKTTLNEFKQRSVFIKDDYRFKARPNKQNTRKLIYMWVEKEKRNLLRMKNIGINCPDFIAWKDNVIVMSFLGTNKRAAPKLKSAHLNATKMNRAYHEVVDAMYRLYNEAELIHGDLSEYNILWHEEKCYFIDVAQSVEPSHASALQFLMRDCEKISHFFTQNGVDEVKTKEELFTHITGLEPSVMERMYEKGPSVSMATAHHVDELPEEYQPLAYPFDHAWDKAMLEKDLPNVHGNSDSDDKESETVAQEEQ